MNNSYHKSIRKRKRMWKNLSRAQKTTVKKKSPKNKKKKKISWRGFFEHQKYRFFGDKKVPGRPSKINFAGIVLSTKSLNKSPHGDFKIPTGIVLLQNTPKSPRGDFKIHGISVGPLIVLSPGPTQIRG